jgi:hypothetical protein
MCVLDYLIEVVHMCIADDANVVAFEEAIVIIGGYDVVEEFLTCDIWPLSDGWEFEVERMESPLSKVIMPMSKVTAIIGKQDTGAAFEARIVVAANQLVGNYNMLEHRACVSPLQHSWLNHVKELVDMNYEARVEPLARVTKKRHAAAVVVVPLPLKKASGGEKRRRPSSRGGDKTSKKEELLAKPLKPSKKFSVQKTWGHSLGLSVHEKTLVAKAPSWSPANTKAGRKKAFTTSSTGDDSGYVLMHVITMIEASVSEGEVRPLKWHQKRVRGSTSPKATLEPLEVATVESSIP